MPIKNFFPYTYILAWVFLSFLPYIYYSTKAYAALLFFLAIFSAAYSVYYIASYKILSFFLFLFCFVAFLSIYGIELVFLGDEIFHKYGNYFIEKNRYILWLFNSMLTVVPIYVFTCKGLLNERIMKYLFFIMFGAAILAFHVTYQQMLIEAALLKSRQEEFTITAVYILLSLLPFVLLFKKNVLLQFVLLVVFFIFFILSAKRGAILLGTIGILFIIWGIISNYSIKKKFAVFIISLIVLLFLYKFTMYQLDASSYLASRFQDTLEGNSSHRDVFIKTALEYMENNYSIKALLFGIGAQGSLVANESFIHNDWVAILLEQGIVGLLLYLLFWIGFFYTWIKSWYRSKESFIAIGTLVVIGFGKTLFSMFYLPIGEGVIISSGFFAIALGYYLGKTFPQRAANEQIE